LSMGTHKSCHARTPPQACVASLLSRKEGSFTLLFPLI
jgi:hypothetical protein